MYRWRYFCGFPAKIPGMPQLNGPASSHPHNLVCIFLTILATKFLPSTSHLGALLPPMAVNGRLQTSVAVTSSTTSVSRPTAFQQFLQLQEPVGPRRADLRKSVLSLHDYPPPDEFPLLSYLSSSPTLFFVLLTQRPPRSRGSSRLPEILQW